ncbi:MAG: acetyl-CoA carboxylase biotin carboxylase subunit [Balneolaceae bacterium]|nr:MAG: acetyl-CoA carboxylase biotin carboxylase subunit [Balneolaceae bacterium]
MFRKILIANRGEIALRVMRTCRELGLQTVAVCSESDKHSPHALYADETVLLEGETISQTYLNIAQILQVARERQADAVHPGYGFLSENAEFAEACAKEQVVFIGPEPHAIRQMGDKTRARELMDKAGVPVPPGAHSSVSTDQQALEIARGIGFPVLVKAAAGGGGKGMRMVRTEKELPGALKTARSESASAFGDDRIYLEKYLDEPRHVEFQIFADRHGNMVHLFERECSIQRRHQKLIEESPSPFLDEALRSEMGDAALRAAGSCGYTGAGTVEFLVDRDRQFYFLEMNTRLQVEHPVTEMITGIDLVALQIRVAEGHPLPWKQHQIRRHGHAIECRICAENPLEQFLPATGTVQTWRPAAGANIRMDEGIRAGQQITAEYDPLLAKLVVYGNNRSQAIARMIHALDETVLTGCPTTIPFCRYVMEHPAFREGRYHTHFIPEHFIGAELQNETLSHPVAIIAGLLHNENNHGGNSWNPAHGHTGNTHGSTEGEPGPQVASGGNSSRDSSAGGRAGTAWWVRRKYRS